MAKIDADNILDDEGNGDDNRVNKYEIVEDFAENDAQKIIDSPY